jgi:hypothetical protein
MVYILERRVRPLVRHYSGAMRNLEIAAMQSHDDVGHCAPDTNGCGSQPREGHSFDERMMAVTAIDYRGRVFTVVSQADATCCSARAPEVRPFMTIMFGGPLGQMTWKADTWADSLRNHETAVCKLIESIASDGCG